jgi:hypothetical protein
VVPNGQFIVSKVIEVNKTFKAANRRFDVPALVLGIVRRFIDILSNSCNSGLPIRL